MSDEKSAQAILQIPTKVIFADPEFNCRGNIKPLDVKILADSMVAMGLQSPILVQTYTKKPGYEYRVVAGHRRFMACMLLQWETVPAIVREGLSDLDAKILNLTENLQREMLNIYQEAQAIKNLGENHSDEWLANKLNVSKGWIQPRKMLLSLPVQIQEEAKAGTINQTIIRDCYSHRSNPEKMFEIVKAHKEAKERGERATVRTSKRDPKVKRQRKPPEIMVLVDMIQKTFGYGLTTRALAWTAGNISDGEMLDTIVETAAKLNVVFIRPEVICAMTEKLASAKE